MKPSTLCCLIASQLGFGGVALAQTDCTTLPNPVYFPATTLIKQFLSQLAPHLAGTATAADQMTIVYQPLSSCNTYDFTADDLDFEGTAIYWDAAGNELSCDMPAGAGIKADLNAMDVGGITCRPGETPPADIKEFPGHVEAIGFVVPRSSSQTAITATEGYYLVKFGAEQGRQVPPWTNPEFIIIRNPGSSTQLTIGAAVGWSGKQWSGNLTNTNRGSGDVFAKLQAENTTGNAEQVIGILHSGLWDENRDTVKVLAFQPFNGCLGAVFPDSTSTAFDKRNVRDGHYPIWTNIRFVTRVGADGNPVDPRVQTFIEIATGLKDSGFNVPEALVASGNIPSCAMSVKREVDGGPLSPFEHPAPCGCFFEEAVQPGSSGCTSCANDTDCTGGEKCSFGFCEPRADG